MASDLISRKALIEKAWDADTRCGYVQVVDVYDIENAPTVDAAPVVHGEWVKSNPHNRFMDCSVCGFYQDHTTFNYCPNCGAKMDGGKKDEM